MKVEQKINQNQGRNLRRMPLRPAVHQRASYQPQFKGAYTEAITNSLHHAKWLKRFKNAEWLKGEIGGILITALGTGAVAPIFIGFNPFVKVPKNATPEQKQENKDTKLYTAMRQPISAALAIIFQASVQKYIDKGLDAIFNNPKIAKYGRLDLDQQNLNTKTYIESQVAKQMKDENIPNPSRFRSWFSSSAREQRRNYNDILNSRVKEWQNGQIDSLAGILENEGIIKIGERQLDARRTAELVNQQIDSYIADAQRLTKSPEKIVAHVKRAQVLIENEEHLKEIFRDVPLEEIKNARTGSPELKNLYQQTTNIVRRLLENEQNPDIKKILQEIIDRPDDLRASRIERTLARIETIKGMCDVNAPDFAANYRDALIRRNNVLSRRIVELTASKIDPNAATTESITNAIKRVINNCSFADADSITQSVLRDTDTFDNNIAKLTKKIYRDITKGYKELVANSYKSWNQFTKIGVGVLVTLPITCTALNWVYPRFMELFFPRLAGVKKGNTVENKEGGNK